MIWRPVPRILIAALLTLALAAPAAATTVVPMSVEELTRASSNVVRARAIESHSEWNTQHTLIYTYTRFQLLSTLKGESSTEFVVRQLGGHAEGYTQKVSGVRHFTAGEEVVLFLRPSEASGMFAVTGLFQGNFAVRRSPQGEALVSNGVAGASSLQQGSVRSYRGAQFTLRQLQQAVARASASGDTR